MTNSIQFPGKRLTADAVDFIFRDAGRALLPALLLFLGSSAGAQEAIRQSLAGEAAAEGATQAASTAGYYNLRVGDTLWRFSSSMGFAYQDNFNLSQNDPQPDFALTPQVTTRMWWPVSQKNSLNLALNTGYNVHFEHSSQSGFFITPDSELAFNIYAGDFLINLHERFTIIDNAYQDPTVANSGQYSQFQNTLGFSALWDLNKAVLKFGYDHLNNVFLRNAQGQNQSAASEEVFSLAAAYALQPQMLLGLEAGAGWINFGNANPGAVGNGLQCNAGPFFQAPITEYLSLNAALGYVSFLPESGGTTDTGDLNGAYGQLRINHRLNQYVNYSLSAGRNFGFTLFGGATDLYYVNLAANWILVRQISLGTGFLYQHGATGGFTGEDFDQFGPQITLSRVLTPQLSASLNYQLFLRNSDLSDRSYTANIVTLNLSYQFGQKP
jgi:hypothetical protein